MENQESFGRVCELGHMVASVLGSIGLLAMMAAILWGMR